MYQLTADDRMTAYLGCVGATEMILKTYPVRISESAPDADDPGRR